MRDEVTTLSPRLNYKRKKTIINIARSVLFISVDCTLEWIHAHTMTTLSVCWTINERWTCIQWMSFTVADSKITARQFEFIDMHRRRYLKMDKEERYRRTHFTIWRSLLKIIHSLQHTPLGDFNGFRHRHYSNKGLIECSARAI